MKFEIRFKKIPAEAGQAVQNRVFLQRRWASPSALLDITTALPYISAYVHGHRNPYIRPPRQRLLER